MARKRIRMNKIKEVLRLHEAGYKKRKIARTLRVSRPVVAQYLIDFEGSKLTYEIIKNLSDEKLLQKLEVKKELKSVRYEQLSGYFDYFVKELKRKGVTLHLLWEEYKQKHSDGYSYAQFCYHFQIWHSSSEVSMHIEHKAGDKMFVDFAGTKMSIVDRQTGEVKEAEVFIAVLGASGLTYAEAVWNQKIENWISVNENALWYFGGVCCALVPDCLKSGVTNPDKYEPDINPAYNDFAIYYDTVILPARPSHPKDKPLVENGVKLAYQRIYAPLRNRTFFSLAELNEAIREQLEIHNNKSFQRFKMSRRQLFEQVEKNILKPLPLEKYEFKKFQSCTVAINYHIDLREDKHYYSVPFQKKAKKVMVIYTNRMVEIYYQNERIASHQRYYGPNKYTTCKEHMPSHHRFLAEWNPQRFITWAETIGTSVKEMVEKIMENARHPEQGYHSCLGIINLGKKYGNTRVNLSCRRALTFNYYSYKTVKNILENKMDNYLEEQSAQILLPIHENVRGSQYYE